MLAIDSRGSRTLGQHGDRYRVAQRVLARSYLRIYTIHTWFRLVSPPVEKNTQHA